MLTKMMEGILLMAPDAGADMANPPVVYGTTENSSAPESGNAAEQAGSGAVSNEGTPAATDSGAQSGESAQQSPAWMAQLPKDLRDDPELAKHRTIGGAIKYLKDEVSKAKEAQGNADAGQQNAPQGNGESVPVKYENFAKRFSDDNDPFGNVTDELVGVLQGSGIEQSVAEGIVEKLDKAFSEGTSKLVQEGVKHTEAVMRKQWGKDYDTNRRLMAKGYQALGDIDGSLQKRMDKEGASLSPAVWDALARVGKLVSEDNASGSSSGQSAPHNEDVPVSYKY